MPEASALPAFRSNADAAVVDPEANVAVAIVGGAARAALVLQFVYQAKADLAYNVLCSSKMDHRASANAVKGVRSKCEGHGEGGWHEG